MNARASRGLVAALLGIVVSAPFPVPDVLAKARPHHTHEDLFDEEDLHIGFWVGPQLTGFTAVQRGDAIQAVQSSMRFVAGGSIKFIYGLPRFEIDGLFNGRGWVNTSSTLFSFATPILVKLPLELDDSKEAAVDLELGGGFQPDFVLGGADPHNAVLMGLLGSIGLSVDFVDTIFQFEMRYNVGFDNVSQDFNGARHRDFQVMLGLAWRF